VVVLDPSEPKATAPLATTASATANPISCRMSLPLSPILRAYVSGCTDYSGRCSHSFMSMDMPQHRAAQCCELRVMLP
jgi:hypothetical protein